MKVLFGKKIKMTRVFSDDGIVSAVTIIQTLPANFSDRINNSDRGYQAIKCNIQKGKKNKTVEFIVGDNDFSDYKKGDSLDEKQFEIGDLVTVSAKSKGKGFSGTIKRYGFSRGPMSHGSNQQRRLGSIGAAYPQHVLKGQKMPGHMGNSNITVKNLKVIDIDNKNHLILISGAIPGANGGEVKIICEK